MQNLPNHLRLMRSLLLLFCLALTGCLHPSRKACINKLERLKVKCPDLFKKDTTKVTLDTLIAGLKVTKDIPINQDSGEVNRLLKEYAGVLIKKLHRADSLLALEDTTHHSTIYIKDNRAEINKLHKEIETYRQALSRKILFNASFLADTFKLDTVGVQVKLWQVGNKLKHSLTIDPKKITLTGEVVREEVKPCSELKLKFYEFWEYWVSVGLLLVLSLFILIKK